MMKNKECNLSDNKRLQIYVSRGTLKRDNPPHHPKQQISTKVLNSILDLNLIINLYKNIMYSIYNTLEDEIIFKGSRNEFIGFVNDIIRIENKDFDFSILGISDALEYIEDYCDNLEIVIN